MASPLPPWIPVIAIVVGSCVDAVDLASTQAAIECEPYVCGQNSPEVDNYGMHELNLDGQLNSSGIRLAMSQSRPQIFKGGVSYDLVVENSRILGRKKGVTRLAGSALIDAEIELYLGALLRYRIRIDSVRLISHVMGPAGQLEVYTLKWYPLNDTAVTRTVCTPPPDASLPMGVRDSYGMWPHESVVFEGDRIDATTKTVDPVRDNSWFNIACQGHTLAKLYFTRHTLASGAAELGTDWEQRQSTLKMLVADYCGTGTSFTVAGEALTWRGGLVDFYSIPRRLEARWTSRGATCLLEPRLASSTLPLARSRFPDIAAAIHAECDLPLCINDDPYDPAGASRVSANPN